MIVVLYMPVIHQGYLQFLSKYQSAEIKVLDERISHQFKPLRKDIRALSPAQIVEALKAWKIGTSVVVADESALQQLNAEATQIVMPDELPMREVANTYFPRANVSFESVFLRWDAGKSLEQDSLEAHEVTSSEKQDQEFIELAYQQAAQSVDQWRQVGAVLVKDGQVLYQKHNHHLPDDYQPHYQGDLRGNFSKGEHIDLTTAQHAEASVVAQAAKEGISIAGCDLYVTTFPCPVCAKLLAETGIKRVLFTGGYSMVDGKRVLEDADIELIRVVR